MIKKSTWEILIVCSWLTGSSGLAQNMLPNGSFDHPENPLAGWNIDYEWANNDQYADNRERVSAVGMESGYSKVCRIESTSDKGTKLETLPIPFEEGYRYTCTLKFKGPDYRICFVGYKWKPGVKPHDQPELSELRQVYKSRAETGKADGWKTVSLELPGKKITKGMQAYLKQIQYITVFVYVVRTGYIDEVSVTRAKDPSVKFTE